MASAVLLAASSTYCSSSTTAALRHSRIPVPRSALQLGESASGSAPSMAIRKRDKSARNRPHSWTDLSATSAMSASFPMVASCLIRHFS